MNIRAALEHEHSKDTCLKIAAFVGSDPRKFSQLLDYVLGPDDKLAQRAAWAFSHTVDRYPKLIEPHLSALIDALRTRHSHPAIYRNILRELQNYPLPEKFHAPVYDLCIERLKNSTEAPAIRVFAMSTAAGIAGHYPELRHELLMVLKGLLDYPQAPAIISRAKKVLKQLKS